MQDVAPDPSFRDLTVRSFVDLLASSAPVPGGGSASAIAASLGAGLVAMVARLSEGRPRYADHADVHATAKARGVELTERLLGLAEEDAVAYGAYAAALKLPRDTPEQQAARSQAVQVAARGAADVPLRCMEACLELIAAAELLAGRSNVNAASDLHVAALLGEAAARGAAANVRINLPAIGDASHAATATARVDALLSDTARLAARVHQLVASGAAQPPLPPGNLA
ncbi:MAG: cyclodeaminase/cyclohydrolase family protein [Chloroflexota bacterium]